MSVRDMAAETRILAALGLGDVRVISAQINIKAGELMTADVVIEVTGADGRLVFEDNTGEVARELHHYELVKRKPQPQLRHAWDDPDYLAAYPPHKHPDFGSYWLGRADHARKVNQPVYVTAHELKTLEDSVAARSGSEDWQKVGDDPAARTGHSTLSGVPVEVDEEAAASQHARYKAPR